MLNGHDGFRKLTCNYHILREDTAKITFPRTSHLTPKVRYFTRLPLLNRKTTISIIAFALPIQFLLLFNKETLC
jgi:hypothetical protein